MKTTTNILKRNVLGLSLLSILIMTGILLPVSNSQAQIWEPEGLNMPGLWNTWINPPTNNLALASYTQVTGGRVTKISAGTLRWQTIFSVAATGGDVVGGAYPWLFTSGPASGPFNNKWANVTVIMNTLQQYTYNNGPDNTITVTDGKWYTMNWQDNGYADAQAIFMETSAQPVDIVSVSVPVDVLPSIPAPVDITISATASAEERFFIRYSADNWTTSVALPLTMAGITGTVSIPGQPAGTVVSYYAFSSTVTSPASDYDMQTIKLNNNSGTNYTYTVSTPPPVIAWANLQWPGSGEITLGGAFDVFGQAYIAGQTGGTPPAAGLQAWIGYSADNTDPSTWTNWIAAPYNAPASGNDEFKGDLGAAITTTGTWYYATRFQLNADPYVYGGFSATGGGFWDGTANLSGTLTVTEPPPSITWANLQYPANGNINPGADFEVFGQVFIAGQTGGTPPAAGLQAWVGFSATNTDPATWTEWVAAPYNAPAGNNDEFKANIGPFILVAGTYYYATRFQKDTEAYVYGGYSATGGGFWDGVNNVSGMLDVMTGMPEGAGNAFRIYPNPTGGPLYLDMTGAGTVLVTDAVGKMLMQKQVSPGKQVIDISAFNNGLYHLQIVTGDQTMHSTVVKR